VVELDRLLLVSIGTSTLGVLLFLLTFLQLHFPGLLGAFHVFVRLGVVLFGEKKLKLREQVGMVLKKCRNLVKHVGYSLFVCVLG